ncbi:MAG TPA: PKD domain-containing protein [Bacteroidia bacterium]|nr:PKD domain-containing protein [Bacteroidia bacterium]
MKRTILSVCVSFVVAITATFPTNTFAQNKEYSEQIEQTTISWNTALENVRTKFAVSKEDFAIFTRFEAINLEALKKDLKAKAGNTNSDKEKMGIAAVEVQNKMETLYNKFLNTKKTYPSSVEEYKHPPNIASSNPCDSSGCTNMDFGQGTLNTWYGYYGVNNGPPILTWYGGALGAVTAAASDPLTGNPLPDNQILVTSSGNDNIIPAIPRVSPWATGGHSVMLGDSSEVLQGAALLEKTFLVTASTANLTYQYAVFLENPVGHSKLEQPFFSVGVLDGNGDTIPNCGAYNVTSGYGTSNFDSTTYQGNKLYYRNWTIVNVPLKNYVGQCVTILFEVGDCSLGGHFGYAYVDATCSPLGLITSSPNFCGQDSISLTAPPGAEQYMWTHTSTDTILTDTTKQTVWVKDSGSYTVICIPVTGATCADTISIHVGKIPGPPPHPSFTADTVCAGRPTQFRNTSDSTYGFSWDFYNIGNNNYTDTNNFNPTWTYINPGIYVVKLNEILKNGCGATVYDTVIVDTNVSAPSFTASPTCFGDTTYFTPYAPGATKYDWNFGEPSSGVHDSSKYQVPGHKYASAGSYTVTFTAENQGGCGAVFTQVITIYAMPTPAIRGKDTVCPGTPDTLFASGGTTYLWNGLYSVKNLPVVPLVTKTYTLQATNGTCSKDTTFTITVVPAPIPVALASKDSVCKGDTITLFGHGGTSYLWTKGSTTSIISTDSTVHNIKILSDTTFKLYEYGGTCKDSVNVTIKIIPAITATSSIQFDSICPGDNDILSASGTGGPATYAWNTGATTSAITVNPTTTTTYTATVNGRCNSLTKILTVKVIPVPIPVITGQNWECINKTSTLTVTSSSSPTTYLWSNGKTTTTITTVPITKDTTYKVIATNALGCKDSTTFTVDLRVPPSIQITPPALACAGNDVLLEATGFGQGPFTYTWTPGGATTDTITVNPSVTTTYTVTVSNGCSSSKSTIVTPDNPPLSACCNKTILVGEDTMIVAKGDTSIISYTWVPDSVVCLNPPLCDSVQVKPNTTTTYTVIGTDRKGCQVERLVTITIEIPCFSLNIPNVFTPSNSGALGLDNVFYIKTENITGWSLVIFDRWGKEMYNSTNPDEFWTGTTKGGGNAPDGVYYYIVTGTCQNVTYKKDGFVQLIR